MYLGSLSGIPLRLHSSFLLLIGYFALTAMQRGGVNELRWTLFYEAVLFGSVVLHEMGHALAARYFGVQTRDITLYPFGGIAALRGMPRTPWGELVVALAGPAVNGVLVLASGFILLFIHDPLLAPVLWVNLSLGVFNLLPAFPMDGGRALRSGLTRPLGAQRATQVALAIGTVFAVLFLVAGLGTGQWSLALVGGFLLFAQNGERQAMRSVPPAWRNTRGKWTGRR